jgi:hypothetical protein
MKSILGLYHENLNIERYQSPYSGKIIRTDV